MCIHIIAQIHGIVRARCVLTQVNPTQQKNCHGGKMNTDDLLAVYVVLSTKGKRKRAIWTKDWLLKREQLGYTHLLRELLPYPEDVHTFLRMDENSYLELLDLVRPRIEKQSTVLRSPIDPHQRLMATLRYLASKPCGSKSRQQTWKHSTHP